jgi:predicted O-linked N-acetylglucosamine transferase (SPINDLY family)
MNNNFFEWFQRGVALQNAGDWVGAAGCFQRAATLNPGVAEIHYNLGVALQILGKQDEAAASYLRAAELNPGFAESYNNLGNIYLRQERFEAAQSAYERALALKPELVQAHYNLGLSLKKQNRLELAVAHFRKAWELAPAYEEAWDNLHDCLSTLKRGEEALQVFLAFERGAAPSLTLLFHGLSACRRLGDVSRETRYLDMLRTWEFKADDAVLVSELLGSIQYFDVEPSLILSLYQTYNRLLAQQRPCRVPLLPPRRTRGEKFRIGYLSPDFRRHVMGNLMAEVFARHDRERFEIYAYSLAGTHLEDEVTERFRAASHKFVLLAGMADPMAARLIAEDDLDLLVDLGGHTAGSRPAILACKPARVQLTHLGYHGAIGLETVDYKLTDEYADVPGNEAYMVEALLPMKGCVFPFRHVEAARQHGYSRAGLGLRGKTVFGAFVNIMKLSPRCLETWRAVLKRVENGVLAFSPLSDDERPGFIRQVSAAGIDPERVVFIPADKDESVSRARYSLIDIVLDTFPYSGGDTTLAALDMAVPVVTLCGKRHGERTSYSILTNLGVTDTIAHVETQYVDMACRLAEDAAWLRAVRKKIKRGLSSSVLVDMDGYVANLEEAYIRAIGQKSVARDPDGKLSALELKDAFQQAVSAHQAGETAQAEALYLRVLEDQPEYAPACHLYGRLLAARGEKEQALEWAEKALAAAPEYEDALGAIGALQLELGRYRESLAALERLLRINPRAHAALNDSGLALMKLGRLDEALAALRGAVAEKPDDPVYQFNLGVACQKRHQAQDAVAAYSRALALQPDYVEAHFNLGVVFHEADHPDRAVACYRQVLKLRPDYELAYVQMGEALFGAGKIDAWLENFRQFEKVAPASFRMAIQAIEAFQYRGEPAKAERYVNGLLKNSFPVADTADLADGLEQLFFSILYYDVDNARLYGLYKAYNEAMSQLYPERMLLPEVRTPGKIRIGYLSADLRDHVMGKMMWEVVARHNPSRFEIFCYSLSAREDAWTEKFRAASHKFVRLDGLEPRAAAERVAVDELDILVDLSTHTKGAMPGILALKPARLQITHIASAGAVGLEAVDFKLTDRYADVPDNQKYLLETLLPMAGCVYPYRHIAPAASHDYRRGMPGLPQDAFVIGAFFNLMKLSSRCLSVWRAVLERIPHAVLAFSPLKPEARESYLRRVRAAGIDASRVVFIPASSNEALNQARYGVVDIVLDTFPYNGANGTLEALDMGVPVVAMVGKRHGERTSFSMLTNLGVTDTLARNSDEYVEIAHRLATDKVFHGRVVDAIRKGMAGSPLVNMEAHVANLENAFVEALKRKGVA